MTISEFLTTTPQSKRVLAEKAGTTTLRPHYDLCSCGRPKRDVSARCLACIREGSTTTRKPCPRCGAPRGGVYVLCRPCAFAARSERPVATHCRKGHLLDEENLLLDGKAQKRRCRRCLADAVAAAQARPLSAEQIASFWERASKSDGCWEWQGQIMRTGYGRHVVNRTRWSAHRLAYLIAVGPIPADKIVCHSCDNRCCVRPDHLWLGTYSDNIQDALRKGRMATGDRHWTRRAA